MLRRHATSVKGLLRALPLAASAVWCSPASAQGGALPFWRVELSAVEVDAVLEGPIYPLAGVSGAALLSDRRIVVADSGSSRLAIVTPAGVRRSVFGRLGEGPGEFRSVTSVEAGRGDTLYVFDERLQRLSVYAPDGTLARVTLVAPTAGLRFAAVGQLGDPYSWYAKEAPSVLSSGVGRDRTSVVLLDWTLQRAREITSVPDMVTGSVTMAGQVATRFVPFTPRALVAHAGWCLYVMSSDEGRVSVFQWDGSQVASVSAPASPRRVTPADKDAWVEDAVRDVPPEAAAEARSALESLPHPPTFPLYEDMLADDLGYVWLREFATRAGSGRRWIVLGRRGAVAQMDLPDAEGILAIRGNTVLAKVRVAPDRVVVRLYTLTGDGGARPKQNGLCPY